MVYVVMVYAVTAYVVMVYVVMAYVVMAYDQAYCHARMRRSHPQACACAFIVLRSQLCHFSNDGVYCYQFLSPVVCHQLVSGVTSCCHQLLSPVVVTSWCHQLVSPVVVTSCCCELVPAVVTWFPLLPRLPGRNLTCLQPMTELRSVHIAVYMAQVHACRSTCIDV